VHLEGRYLNVKKRGAHAENMLAPLTADELLRFAMKKALHISAAFELDIDGSFSRAALGIGATLGLGHTLATYAEAKKAEENGVTSYTHLFNAMPPLHHRDGGAVAACLLGNGYAELICDGIHIAPEMIALAYKCKGAEGISLISDSMEATGCADGEYSIAGNPVTVKDGKALTHDGALAGSTLTLDEAVQNLVDFCSIPLTDAILCATETPAKQMGIFDFCGSIDVGKKADILFCDAQDVEKNIFKIKKIMLRGNFIN
jgi:N-acetylglucosamine-6-phosphate deacetylase